MKFARVVAVLVVLAAGLAVFFWLRGASPTGASERGGSHGVATKPAPHDPPDVPPAATPNPTRVPEAAAPAANGAWRVELDLRGPGDVRLAAGRVRAQHESPGKEVERPWRRDAPAVELDPVAWTLIAEAESDPAPDAIPCGDLVSDPTSIDPSEPPPSPLVIRLHARSGIYGRLLGASARLRCGVRWQALDSGRTMGATELALHGHDATIVPLAGDGVAYSVHDLEPGRYAIAGRGDPGAPLETPCEVEVADAMVQKDLSLAAIDATTMLHAVVQGLTKGALARVAFLWIGDAGDSGGSDAMRVLTDAPGSFWLAPTQSTARAQLQRVLDGTLGADERVALALARDSVVAAQPLTSGQREVRFLCDAPARLRVRFTTKAVDGAPMLRLALAPAAATALLDLPPALWAVGSEADPKDPADKVQTFAALVPGDFVLATWGQLHSELRHGEVWWPLARRDVVVRGGEEELEVDRPPLHPLTIRFDRDRFGKDAQVQVVLRSYPKWPLFALPDEAGLAKFEALPDGDYTGTVVGDMAGEKDFTLPGTSELRIEPTRREEH